MAQKVTVFIIDGIVDCAYTTASEIEITVVDFDKCRDSREDLETMYEEMEADKDMCYKQPDIVHP